MRKRGAFSFSLLFQTTLRCVQNVLNPFNLTYQKATHLQHLAVCNYWSNLGHEAFFLSCFFFWFLFFTKTILYLNFLSSFQVKQKIFTTANIIFSALFICLQFNAPFVVTIIHIIFSSVCCKMQLFVNALSKLPSLFNSPFSPYSPAGKAVYSNSHQTILLHHKAFAIVSQMDKLVSLLLSTSYWGLSPLASHQHESCLKATADYTCQLKPAVLQPWQRYHQSLHFWKHLHRQVVDNIVHVYAYARS